MLPATFLGEPRKALCAGFPLAEIRGGAKTACGRFLDHARAEPLAIERTEKRENLKVGILGRRMPGGRAGGEKSPVHRQAVAGGVNGAAMSGGTAAGRAGRSVTVGAFDLKGGVAGRGPRRRRGPT